MTTTRHETFVSVKLAGRKEAVEFNGSDHIARRNALAFIQYNQPCKVEALNILVTTIDDET